MKRKVLSLLLAVVMLVSAIPAMGASAAGVKVFYDVPQNAWYARFVYPLSEAGIVKGTDSTHFTPNRTLMRSEFLTMLARTIKDESEFKAYDGLGLCPDADNNGKVQWYSGYVNWAAQEGIIPQGENFRPKDKILRSEAVELTYAVHTAYPDTIPLTPVQEPTTFADQDSIPESILEALTACNRANVINGTNKGNFSPNGILDRASATKMICRMLEIEEWDASQIPAPPKFETPTVGSAYGASYVELDPQSFTAKIALANGRLDNSAPASSILSGQGAYVAVNGTVFDTGSKTVYGTLVSGGKIIRDLSAPANQTNKPAFVIDSNGKASIQWLDITQTIRLTKGETTYKAIENVSQNVYLANSDGSRMIYTREYGSVIPGTVRYALVMDNNNKVTKTYTKSTNNVPIPSSGYVLCERMERGWDNDDIFKNAKVGDTITREITYKGSSVQDIQTAISCGPTVLKNGAVYGNSTTYAQEGFTADSHVVGSGSHILIGVKPNGRVVIASASGSQRQMGEIMKNLGCKDAMNLDGGASTYLNCNGRQLASPGRELTNMLVFSRK